MAKLKLTNTEFKVLVENTIKKVLKEDWYNEDYTDRGAEDYSLSGLKNNNSDSIYPDNDGEVGQGRDISIDELVSLAEKAADIVLDAGQALSDLAVQYGDTIPLRAVEETLMEYDMTLDDLYDEEDSEYNGEFPEQGDHDAFESKKPRIVKMKISELKEIIKQIISENN